ncbi:hypothetical protein L1987_63841 [Smallanthus sonchifolius]|uniref:Uncharacterized protein n=1 Tax=Smallanthus sonchifolius TaxID=185202 RepID=A0ACB9CEE7_9ASTR|nr:hypothetical protein L1987_63841 [Smallanthus sonchifolius]
MIDFLCRSKIHHALTVNPTIYIPYMEDFWNTTVYSTEQGIPQIKSKVDGKDIIISEATLRKHLQLQDEGAAISYSKEEYMRTFVSIGYTGNQNEYTIEKALMGPPWKYLCHTLLQCISQKRSGWHQVSSTLASAVHGMITDQGFNFAHLIFEDLSKPSRIYIMLGHKNNIFQTMRIVSKKFSGVNVPLLSTMVNIQSTQCNSSAIPADTDPTPSTSHPEQQAASIARTPVQTTKDTLVQKSLTPLLDVIVQLEQRALVATTSTRNRSKKTPLLVSKAQSQPQSPHSESQNSEAPCQDDMPSPTTTISEVLIDLAADAPNPSSSPKKVHSGGSDRVNVERAVTTSVKMFPLKHSSMRGIPRRQENQGDGDAEARPKAPSCSKYSTTMDENRLKLHNLELTARVAMLEVEVSKLRHQVSMHESHQCPSMTTPSLISVGTQTDHTLCTDATKKGEDWKLVVRAVDEVLQDETPYEDTHPSFSILPEAAAIISRNLYLTRCVNTSSDLLAELAISRFYDLMEDNIPWFERLLKEANRAAYPESSSIAEKDWIQEDLT